MLTAVAVFAVALNIGLSYRMSGEYRRRALFYTRAGESAKNLAFHVESGETPLVGYTAEEKRKVVDQSREWIAYADRMRRKYEFASYLPWLAIQPDPPPPGSLWTDGRAHLDGRAGRTKAS